MDMAIRLVQLCLEWWPGR